MMPSVAVLFAHARSPYRALPECDVWDADRNALLWPGGLPVIAHPPCRLWGRLRQFSTAPSDEKDLARWAVAQVRQWGGVLEHPASSLLWADCDLPRPQRDQDAYGGWTMAVLQYWWGHRAEKATWLYVVECAPGDVPPVPLALGQAPAVIKASRRSLATRKALSHTARELTPPRLAAWLVLLAQRCREGPVMPV